MRLRSALRWILALFYTVAGIFHLAVPAPFLIVMPAWVPFPAAMVMWTGIAEIAGAIALAQPWSARLRRAGAIGLALYAICVFPANIEHFAQDLAKPNGGLGLIYHIPRMFAQPLIVWLALWVGGVTDWPAKRRPSL